MELIIDLHIHSHFSRACSKDMNIASLYRWGKIKGINIIGTGDFTHPLWFAEALEKLEPAEPGLFKLKDEYAREQDKTLPKNLQDKLIRFILTAEISNIYSKGGKVRKLHNLVVAPSFEVVSKINGQLDRIGNLKSDGRPILGLDSKKLLQIVLDASADALLIPAHIWTPWFAMFGSKSGFDSIEEAFEDLAPHIHAIETGLSSDPFMNWRLKALQKVTIISNSDAHSAPKLGREATVFDTKLDYFDIVAGIKTNDKRVVGTIEFYPQEGKYHYDGHRACGIRFKPSESKEHNLICPKCGKPLVLGVDYRVDQIADFPEDYKPENHKKVEYIIPLSEMLSEIFNVKSVNSTKVKAEYEKLYSTFGDEFSILRKISAREFSDKGFTKVAEAISNMRAGKIYVDPGFDGVFGIIKVFGNTIEKRQLTEDKITGQMGLGI